MNKLILAGHVGKVQETIVRGETKIVVFSLATKGLKDHTDWHYVKAFNKSAELIEKYVDKGTYLVLDCRVATSTYEDKDGKKKHKSEIVLNEMEFGPKTAGASSQKSEINDLDQLPF